MRKLGQIQYSRSEDLCVFLQEVHGAPHVVLRVHRRSGRPGEDSLAQTGEIAVPVDVFPALVRLVGQGLGATPQAGEPVVLSAVPCDRYSRRESRDHRRLQVGCRFLSSADSRSLKTVTGETRDVSNGGVQVRLPERISPRNRVEVSMRIGALDFQGHAEVVDVQTHRTMRGYRHSLRWIGLTPQEKAALSQAILASGFVGLGALDRREMRHM